MRDFVEKNEKGYCAIALKIEFGQKSYSVDCNTGLTEYKIAIVEDGFSYSAIYGDGLWADDYPNVARLRRFKRKNIYETIEVLCRNWDSILEGAYTKIKEAYQNDTEEKLKLTLTKLEDVSVRYSKLVEK